MLDCMHSPFNKITCILSSPLLLWRNFSELFDVLSPGCSPHIAPSKTYVTALMLWIFLSTHLSVGIQAASIALGDRAMNTEGTYLVKLEFSLDICSGMRFLDRVAEVLIYLNPHPKEKCKLFSTQVSTQHVNFGNYLMKLRQSELF